MIDQNASILITGASGMVGQSLVKVLKKQGFRQLLTPSSRVLDVRSQPAVDDFFGTHKPEYVFHLAGHIGGIKASITRPVEFMYENQIMALNVIQAAKTTQVKKLLFVGSSCIYPRQCPQPMREEHLLSGALEPTNEGYALAKISGIKLCEYMNAQFSTNFIALIPCNIYGYNDHFEPENSHVISALMYKMHAAKQNDAPSVEVWGSGNTRREFIFVDDFSEAMIHFMNTWNPSKGTCFVNTGSGVDQSVSELAHLIKDVVGYSGELHFDVSKPDGMPKKLMAVERAREAGWMAQTNLREGLRKTYDWYVATLNNELGQI